MKTKSQNTKSAPGFRVQSSNHHQTAAAASAPAKASEQTAEHPALPQINFKHRRANRALNTERVIALLRKEAPDFFNLVEVVGQWIWIQFKEKQPREVTASLSEFGFHWNGKRQTWQHPCGQWIQRTAKDPRGKYQSYFPANAKAV